MLDSNATSFSVLFKKFRLKSELYSLSSFADALAGEGIVYENSIFCRWQKGTRVPCDRKVLVSILKVFIKKGAITNINEANALLNSAKQVGLTNEEMDEISGKMKGKTCFFVPNEPENFIGREHQLKEVCWNIINNKTSVLYGVAGIGKTTLAIKAGHLLKNRFLKGVLWYRYDIRKIDNILNDIARLYDEDISKIKDIHTKSQIVKQLLSKGDTLLILDNVDDFSQLRLLTPTNELIYPLLITSRKNTPKENSFTTIRLSGFTEQEVIRCSQSILGRPFVITKSNEIKELGTLVGQSPLALILLLKQIEADPKKLDTYLDRLGRNTMSLKKLLYDNKNLDASLQLSFDGLDQLIKSVFISLGIFQGTDFSVAAVSYINDISIKTASKILEDLQKMSLVEKSVSKRYRLHLLIRFFVQGKIKGKELHIKLSNYYEELFTEYGKGNSLHYQKVEDELDNIYGLLNQCFELKLYNRVIALWDYFGLFLWDTGRWSDVEKYGRVVIDSCQKENDNVALASCYIDELSWLYFWYGDFAEAESCALKGLQALSNEDNKELRALGNQRLGMVCQAKGSNEKAEEILNKSLSDFQNLKIWFRVANTFLYIGHTYKNRNKLNDAKTYYNKSLKSAEKTPEHEAYAIAVYYLGEVSLLEQDYETAKDYFHKALLIDKERQRKPGIPWCLYGLGRVAYAKGDIANALKLYEEAKKLYIQLGIESQIEKVHNDLALINSFGGSKNKDKMRVS